MKYMLTFILSIFLSYGSLASETDPLNPHTVSINSIAPDTIVMQDDAPSVPLGYKAGHCYGHLLACWNKQKDDDQAEGLGLKFQKVASNVFEFSSPITGICALICLNCGICGCCYNGDACCVRYAGSACVFCGNGGCILTAKWTGVAAASLFGMYLCCSVSRACCKDESCLCQQLLAKLKCDNCANGIKDGYNKKIDSKPSQQPQESYQDIANLQMI